MRIEDEIKQKKFRSEFEKLAVNLLYTHGWLINKHSQFLEPFGITLNQYNILRILRGQHPNPASINLLKERMLDKMSDASRLVERLRVKGLIDRKICENDRRKAEVFITEKGLETLAKLDNAASEIDNILGRLEEKEAEILNDLLDRLRS
ncbi:MAG: MarR family transcriptional regulator [Melioribacteraceae bacterium]|nr:MarR family transcriptional regulator [Melioribacteraceae bacterium]MCF8263396.1 MarR family transcriptional regulator [Melioribacteraceae bacterium]MCF8414206.1 MarR family transcriptional regulator [Melioribacteraceae bacterium]MCF8430882.1 MarR family transcriptional regulator [Melioribacteraceae bacterium]